MELEMVKTLENFVERFKVVCPDKEGKVSSADKQLITAVEEVISALCLQSPKQPPTPLVLLD